MSNRAKNAPTWLWMTLSAGAFVLSIALYLHFNAPTDWSHTDEWVYRAAGGQVHKNAARLYDVLLGSPGQIKLPFTYTPFAALIFATFSPLSFHFWQLAIVVIDIALLPVVIAASLRISGIRGIRALAPAALGLAALALWLEPVYMTLFFGQINLVLLALIVLDLALPDSHPLKGVGIGVAAGIKLTPLIFVVYLLLSRRIRAGLVALGSFAVTLLIGLALLPRASLSYWGGKFSSPTDHPEMLVDQSVNAVFQRLLHHHAQLITAGYLSVALVAGCAGLAIAALASRRGWELFGVVMCGLTGLLVSPISWSHHWVWTVPGLVLLLRIPRASIRTRVAGAVILLGLFVMWPTHFNGSAAWKPGGLLRIAPHNNGLEYTWRGFDLILGNYYSLTGLLIVALAAGYLWKTRTDEPGLVAPAGPERSRVTT